MRIVFPDPIDIPQKYLQTLDKICEIVHHDTMPKDDKEILSRIKDADIITANWIEISRNVINESPKLKYIIVPAVGYEWVDIKYARSKNIKVSNCPGYNANAVAEHAFAILLALVRKVPQASAYLASGNWSNNRVKKFEGSELRGKKLCLLGYGNIGKAIHNIAEGFGMNTEFVNSKTKSEKVNDILMRSDIIILSLPEDDSTRNFLSSERINILHENAVVVNVGRGSTVDQTALMKALESKGINSAALDVFVEEPNGDGINDSIDRLANMDNVIATPHIAFNTVESRDRLGRVIVDNVRGFIEGNPINLVNI